MQEYFRRETWFKRSLSECVQHGLNGKVVFFVCSNIGQSLPIWPSQTHALLSLHRKWNHRAVSVIGGISICRKVVGKYGETHCSASQIINQRHYLFLLVQRNAELLRKQDFSSSLVKLVPELSVEIIFLLYIVHHGTV